MLLSSLLPALPRFLPTEGPDSLLALDELFALTTSVTLLPSLFLELLPLPKLLTSFAFSSLLGKVVLEPPNIFEALFPFALSPSDRLLEISVSILLGADTPSCVSVSISSGKSVTLARYASRSACVAKGVGDGTSKVSGDGESFLLDWASTG